MEKRGSPSDGWTHKGDDSEHDNQGYSYDDYGAVLMIMLMIMVMAILVIVDEE